MAKKIKIAISLLSGVGYGSVTYFQNLIPALAEVDKNNEYHIFIQRDNPLLKLINQENFIFHRFLLNARFSFIRHFWEQIIMPIELKKLKIDIMFTAKNANILLAPCKTVTSIRNMEPLCYRKYKNDWKLNFFSYFRYLITKISVKKAHRIVAVSGFVKSCLEERFPEAAHKIDVVYNGNPAMDQINKSNLDRGNGRFLLSASKFVAYANQFNLVQGYFELFKENKDLPSLWIAGGVLDKHYFKMIMKFIKENDLENKVIILGLVSHERLKQLYANALAFLFPSTLEACPQTLIEVMTYGIPIAAANVPPMPEICENAALYFEPYNKKDISDKIKQILTNKDLRNSLKEASLMRCKFFSWQKTARQLEGLFSNIA